MRKERQTCGAPRRGAVRLILPLIRRNTRCAKTPGERIPPPPTAEPFVPLRLRASHPRTYRNPAIRTKIRKIRENPARGRVFRRSPPEFRCFNNVIRNSIVKIPPSAAPIAHAERRTSGEYRRTRAAREDVSRRKPKTKTGISPASPYVFRASPCRPDASGPRYPPESALLNEKFIFFEYFVIYELDKYFFIR